MAPFPLFVCSLAKVVQTNHLPNHTSVKFFGKKDGISQLKLQKQISCISNTLRASSEPTMEEIRQANVFFVYVDGKWMRAQAAGPILSSTSDYQCQVLCIDYGFKRLVPSLGFMRLFPPGTEKIQNHPPIKISEFLLADVLVEAQSPFKSYVKLYLEEHIINRSVKAISLGFVEDYEVVRLYTNCGQLLAKSLLDGHLVVENETYKTALKHLPVDGLISPMSELSLSPIRDAQTKPVPKIYTLSSLEMNTDYQVTVLNIQNGIKSFTVFNKLDETERSRIVSQLLTLETTNLNPLLNPVKGQACIVISRKIHVTPRRGLILGSQTTHSDICSVYLVDFGVTVSTQSVLLYEIPDNFMESSILSIRASLANAEIFDPFEFSDVSEIFTSVVQSKTFTARVSDGWIRSSSLKLHLRDSEGRDVKDLTMDRLNSRQTLVKPVSSFRANLKIQGATVLPEEKLFVTFCCQNVGSFYGQFGRRPMEDLEALEAELLSIYSALGKLPLLFEDGKNHIGDYAVMKWDKDNKLYRAQIIENLRAEKSFLVRMVDYGDLLEVLWCDVYSPVSTLKLFTQGPFGIICRLNEQFHLTSEGWTNVFLNNQIQVQIGTCVERFLDSFIYSAVLSDVPINAEIISTLKPLSFPRIACEEVFSEENLIVTRCNKIGEFFGQFSRRSAQELKEMESELHTVFDSLELKPLLYAVNKNHRGDNGFIRWAQTNRFRRVKILYELPDSQAMVMLVDYGHYVQVPTNCIWAPVSELKLFSQSPFGIDCRINRGSCLTEDCWKDALLDKSVVIDIAQLIPAEGGSYTVALTDCDANAEVEKALIAGKLRNH